MKHLKKFNEEYIPGNRSTGEPFHLPLNDEENEILSDDSAGVDSLTLLVHEIITAFKHDVDDIEEADPEFIPYIADMIKNWHENNK